MADTYLRVIPSDPLWVPGALARERALTVLREAAPLAEDLRYELSDDVRFVDCGANFESVRCPACARDIGEWWSIAMEMGHEQRFRDLRVTLPCCGLHTTLNDLVYAWPAGFARYTLEALNPVIDTLPARVVRRLETALDTKVRIIWAHY